MTNQIVTESAPTLADVFRRAAEVLREKGHCKGSLRDMDGRVCMWGAIKEAAVEFGDLELFYADETADLIEAAHLDDRHGFPGADWNDEDERTGTEVEKQLLAFADRAEFGGDR